MANQNKIDIKETMVKEIVYKDEDKAREILKQRAELLKISITEEEIKGAQLEVLEFKLANESYAIDSNYITSVISLKELTPLPCTPEFILGIININGRILAVINIKEFLNLSEKAITNLNKVILLKYQNIELGILADEIIGSTYIYTDKLQATISTLKGEKNDYLEGITENRSILLNIKKILTDDMIIINDEV